LNEKINSVRTINARKIEKSKELMLGTSQKDIEKYENVVSVFGNVAPAIVAESGGMYHLLDGCARVLAYERRGVNDIPVVVTDAGEVEKTKLSLLLSASREKGCPLSEGALIEKLVIDYGCTLVELSSLTGRSKAWLSTRQSMSRNLAQPVRVMIQRGTICTRTAEEVAKLPQNKQALFAANIVKDNLSKNEANFLVKLHRSVETTTETKNRIIISPSDVIDSHARSIKTRRKEKYNRTIEERICGTADYIVKLLKELDDMIYEAGGIQFVPEASQLVELCRKMRVTSSLLFPCEAFSRENEGGVCFD